MPAEAVNVADVVPEATVTDDGTVSSELSLVSEMTAPLVPAAWERVTVHAAEESFFTDLPLQFTEPTTVCVASVTVTVTERLL